MHVELPVFDKDWSNSFGTSRFIATSSDVNSEQSYFVGAYGDHELPNKLTLLPYTQLLYQDCVQGENQKVHSGLARIDFENDQ